MNAIDQEQTINPGAAYGATSMILCVHPHCNEVFEPGNGKKYHSTDCKNDHHAIIRDLGLKQSKRGKIKAALLENSPRLQRVARFLSDGKPHSTMEIQIACQVCAVGTIVQELKDTKNGFDIECEQIGRDRWEYKMVSGFEQLLRIV